MQGRLLHLQLDLSLPDSSNHAVHLGTHGMRPEVRHLLDWLKQATHNLQ
ncbi:MAG TPA: hypothetical protein VJY31_05735 [Buttiauxella sp.]|nr:hypothetical protein [Buttiauxella sp.]